MRVVASLFVGLLILSLGAPAVADTVVKGDANINQGNWRVGGTVGWGYSNYGGGSGTVAPKVSYFLMDHFALGATVDLYYSPSFNSSNIGPVVTFYPWAEANWAFYLEQEFQFQKYSTSSSSDATLSYTRAGLEYFVVPQVAVGPSLTYFKYISGPSISDQYFVALKVGFNIYF